MPMLAVRRGTMPHDPGDLVTQVCYSVRLHNNESETCIFPLHNATRRQVLLAEYRGMYTTQAQQQRLKQLVKYLQGWLVEHPANLLLMSAAVLYRCSMA
jgi:hypothetical protein